MGYVEDREKTVDNGLAFPYDIKVSLADNFSKTDDLVKVAAFIAWHESNMIWGGVDRNEAFEAFCRIAGIKVPARVFEIVREGEKYV